MLLLLVFTLGAAEAPGEERDILLLSFAFEETTFFVTQILWGGLHVVLWACTLFWETKLQNNWQTTGRQRAGCGRHKRKLIFAEKNWGARRTPIPEGPALVTTVLRIAVS